MNEIINKFLLAEDIFIPEMHLKQPAAPGKPGFIYSACGSFTKNKEKIQKLKKNRRHKIYLHELDEACFQNFKNLAKRTASDKVLRSKAFDTAKNPKYDGYQRGLVSMVYKFLEKKSAGSGVTTLENKSA